MTIQACCIPGIQAPPSQKTSLLGCCLPFHALFPMKSRNFGINWIRGQSCSDHAPSALPSGIFQSFADPSQRILGCEIAVFTPDPRKISYQTSLAPPSAVSHSFLFFHQNPSCSRGNSPIPKSPAPLSLPSIIPKTAKENPKG